MHPLTLLAVAFGLGTDAFAVAMCTGCKLGKIHLPALLRMSLAFGFFQFIMPLIGWLIGSALVSKIQQYDHWVAFILLAVVGIHMVKGGLTAGHEDTCEDSTRGWTLLLLSVATSLDALAIGISLSMLHFSLWVPAIVIGVVTFGMTAAGMLLGTPLGMLFGKKMEIVGGLVLIGIGIGMLAGH
jgi:putative Mn2+ efflux pump MntP